eukprot:7193362-Pyramimonas_sp.AAC.1
MRYGNPSTPGAECLALLATFFKSGASGAATWRSCADFRERSRCTCVANSAEGVAEKTGLQ